jgi:predicted ATPase
MPRVVITGAPGVGKTTLLGELALEGCRTVSESARAIIAARRAAGLSPRPRPREFAGEIFRRDIEKYRAAEGVKDWVFFDRSAVEALAMVHAADPLSSEDLGSHLAQLAYHPRVFILPPWKEIYTTDAERDQSFEHAEEVHEDLVRWYSQCGYALHTVPRQPAKERALHVLHALECGPT